MSTQTEPGQIGRSQSSVETSPESFFKRIPFHLWLLFTIRTSKNNNVQYDIFSNSSNFNFPLGNIFGWLLGCYCSFSLHSYHSQVSPTSQVIKWGADNTQRISCCYLVRILHGAYNQPLKLVVLVAVYNCSTLQNFLNRPLKKPLKTKGFRLDLQLWRGSINKNLGTK